MAFRCGGCGLLTTCWLPLPMASLYSCCWDCWFSLLVAAVLAILWLRFGSCSYALASWLLASSWLCVWCFPGDWPLLCGFLLSLCGTLLSRGYAFLVLLVAVCGVLSTSWFTGWLVVGVVLWPSPVPTMSSDKVSISLQPEAVMAGPEDINYNLLFIAMIFSEMF
ncbi:hypothetical protein O6H91_17G043800 [Diphasiastrum complanatum]|uniref:Uncharacterized protein n=1 Tax=Diphasiastrum complanatum TaxID=34168 RepID=A0ACC2B679_DIPCM|nr:hypothetical protein O6H91_17G043800 [Diphasiastrum complanatum]